MNNVWKLSLGTPDPLSSLLALSGAAVDPSLLARCRPISARPSTAITARGESRPSARR